MDRVERGGSKEAGWSSLSRDALPSREFVKNLMANIMLR